MASYCPYCTRLGASFQPADSDHAPQTTCLKRPPYQSHKTFLLGLRLTGASFKCSFTALRVRNWELGPRLVTALTMLCKQAYSPQTCSQSIPAWLADECALLLPYSSWRFFGSLVSVLLPQPASADKGSMLIKDPCLVPNKYVYVTLVPTGSRPLTSLTGSSVPVWLP